MAKELEGGGWVPLPYASDENDFFLFSFFSPYHQHDVHQSEHREDYPGHGQHFREAQFRWKPNTRGGQNIKLTHFMLVFVFIKKKIYQLCIILERLKKKKKKYYEFARYITRKVKLFKAKKMVIQINKR